MDEELDYSCCLKKIHPRAKNKKSSTRSYQTFPCHRGVLSANSSYFRAMFGGKPRRAISAL
ncbi:unnamed protein product, partial [Ranitomeya imitator]